jgi:hypothetical protein
MLNTVQETTMEMIKNNEFNEFLQANVRELITGKFQDEYSPYHIFEEVDAYEYNEAKDKESFVKEMIADYYYQIEVDNDEILIPNYSEPNSKTIAKFINVLNKELKYWI